MQVGTTEDQGLYNKPSAAVHPGALAAGTLPQYNTIQYNTDILRFRITIRKIYVMSSCDDKPRRYEQKWIGILYPELYSRVHTL